MPRERAKFPELTRPYAGIATGIQETTPELSAPSSRARRFLAKAMRPHGTPETITIDGSEANAAAIRSYHETHGTAIAIRRVRYLSNIVEQDHRAARVAGPRRRPGKASTKS
jgi:transposase-like protein